MQCKNGVSCMHARTHATRHGILHDVWRQHAAHHPFKTMDQHPSNFFSPLQNHGTTSMFLGGQNCAYNFTCGMLFLHSSEKGQLNIKTPRLCFGTYVTPLVGPDSEKQKIRIRRVMTSTASSATPTSLGYWVRGCYGRGRLTPFSLRRF